MAKISKRILAKHNEAVELLKKEELNFNDREFIFYNYHEGAGKMNNLISAHFTPYSIARSIMHNVAYPNCFVDLCAGIGILSYALKRQNEWDNAPIFGICIENCTEYYEVGKKLLPEFHWINGDCFDPKVMQEVRDLLNDRKFSIVSNPPYGKQIKTNTKDLLKYSGGNFEYKAVEWGAIMGAYDGAYLIPQSACPFKYSFNQGYEEQECTEYDKFNKQTGLELKMNTGYSTEIPEDDEGGDWKDVKIITEVVDIDYYDLDYRPKTKKYTEEMHRDENGAFKIEGHLTVYDSAGVDVTNTSRKEPQETNANTGEQITLF